MESTVVSVVVSVVAEVVEEVVSCQVVWTVEGVVSTVLGLHPETPHRSIAVNKTADVTDFPLSMRLLYRFFRSGYGDPLISCRIHILVSDDTVKVDLHVIVKELEIKPCVRLDPLVLFEHVVSAV